jgi:hypothetical protein
VAALSGQPISLTSGELAISNSVQIQGPGADQLTISGTAGRSRAAASTTAFLLPTVISP